MWVLDGDLPRSVVPDSLRPKAMTGVIRTLDGKAWLQEVLQKDLGLIKVLNFQALSNVPPLRNYFLEEDNYKNIKRPPGDIMFLLVQRFGELMRKLWNPRNFKAHVSPHEMLQAVVLCSKKTFQITKQGKKQVIPVALTVELVLWIFSFANFFLMSFAVCLKELQRKETHNRERSARNFFLVSHLGSRGPDIWTVLCGFSLAISRELDL